MIMWDRKPTGGPGRDPPRVAMLSQCLCGHAKSVCSAPGGVCDPLCEGCWGLCPWERGGLPITWACWVSVAECKSIGQAWTRRCYVDGVCQNAPTVNGVARVLEWELEVASEDAWHWWDLGVRVPRRHRTTELDASDLAAVVWIAIDHVNFVEYKRELHSLERLRVLLDEGDVPAGDMLEEVLRELALADVGRTPQEEGVALRVPVDWEVVLWVRPIVNDALEHWGEASDDVALHVYCV